MAATTPRSKIDALIEIMAALRTPGSGCPWDLKQTFETIAPYTIEEAYEVAEAIGERDMAALKDELGDLLLQVVYHARIAEETGAFVFNDVVDAISEKMVRRHPHVFGNETIGSDAELDGQWERIKAQEKANDGSATETHLLDDVPKALPALTRSLKLQKKAARVGFDWPSIAPVFEKAREELGELEEATTRADADGSRDDIEVEYGDFLFVIANMARHLKIDPEHALRRACGKFTQRFGHIEKRISDQGRTLDECDLQEMEELWNEAKALESKSGTGD
jgi:MazG family protein